MGQPTRKINNMTKAVVLLSGGMDSATALAVAKSNSCSCYALSIDYGQRNKYEIRAAQSVAEHMGVLEHKIISLDLTDFGGSALTDKTFDIPLIESPGIPVTYVPARNTIFFSLALAWCEVINGDYIYSGVNAIDYSGYPDCRPKFIESFEQTANLATKAGVNGNQFKIHTPLIDLTKAEIVKKGTELGVDYGITTSCYDPHENGNPCGHCDACILRLKGFMEAGLEDPLNYK